MMGDFIFATFITLIAVLTPVIDYSSSINVNSINIIHLFSWRLFKVKPLYLIIISAG